LLPERVRETHAGYRARFNDNPQPRSIGSGRTLFACRADGSEFPVEVGLTPFREGSELRVAASVVDISARVAAEQALRQAQKMETIGHLTGGIAHDFNNLLGIIGGNLQILAETLHPDDPNLPLVHSAANATRRGSELVRSLLTVSRRQMLDMTAVDIAETCDRMLPMLQRLLGERIVIRTEISPELWPALTDPAHFESAVLNLVVNARDAMPEGGRLTIELRNVSILEEAASPDRQLAPGDYVALTISDTGCGMDADTLARIHEPFFTTKGPGQGTGLGLPMVFAFARESHGFFDIASRPGLGTASTLLLPRAVAKATA
jgi:signal transduction histidine kinase